VLFLVRLPGLGLFAKDNPDMSAFMMYRERQWEREGRTLKIRHRYVPLAGISPYLVKAVIISRTTSSGAMRDSTSRPCSRP
jgi:membrane peptidoglycan carboxypeptidase